jgi:hypothetical protein
MYSVGSEESDAVDDVPALVCSLDVFALLPALVCSFDVLAPVSVSAVLAEDADVSPSELPSEESEDPPGCTDALLSVGWVVVAELLGVESTVDEEADPLLATVVADVALLWAALVVWVMVTDGAALLVPELSVVDVTTGPSLVLPSEQADSSGRRILVAATNVAVRRFGLRIIGDLAPSLAPLSHDCRRRTYAMTLRLLR